jgi:signal-transduction protein with cAMP-binding, CBS, and nucleotidyltransferase domain
MMNLRHDEREPVTVAADTTVADIADRMDEESVGSVVVVDDAGAPLGIVTDRDLVRRVVAAGADAEKTTARDVMSTNLVCGERGEPLRAVIEKARGRGVRRIPLLKKGKVVTVVSLDDLLFQVSVGLFGLADATRMELRDAERAARRRRRSEAREDALDELRTQLTSLTREARERLREQLAALIGRPFGGR